MINARCSILLALLIATLAVKSGMAQDGSLAADTLRELDCVIEPKLTIKLGNTETGIVESVNVDRDTVVKRGDVVARLDSELQRIAVDLAELKAGNDKDIKSEKKRLAYRTT